MAERRRIIEGAWKCTSCGTAAIPGRHKTCPSCGNPRDSRAEMQFDFGSPTASGGSTADTVTDAALLAQAEAGADWSCPFCGSGNAGNADVCRNCNAGRQIAPQPVLAAAAPVRALMPPTKARSCLLASGLGCAVLVVGFVLLVALGAWLNVTHEYEGRLVDRSWTRESVRQRYTRVTKEGWQDELRARPAVMPVSGVKEVAGIEAIRDCARRQRGTRKVADGQQRVCRDVTRRLQCGTEERCTTKDLGNGFAEEVCRDVPKYCDESRRECELETRYREDPVYGVSCRYDTYEWRPSGQLREAGRDEPPRWPAQPLAGLEREKRSESYELVFEYRDGVKKKRALLKPASEAEFVRWTAGAEAVLTIDNSGEVKGARPEGTPASQPRLPAEQPVGRR